MEFPRNKSYFKDLRVYSNQAEYQVEYLVTYLQNDGVK